MMKSKRIAIVGAGGFARELAWLISDISHDTSQSKRFGAMEVAGFLVSDSSKVGEHDSEILGDFTWLERNQVDGLALGIGHPEVRLRLGQELRQRFPGISWPALIHPSVQYHESCRFAAGVTICAGSIATVNVTIEEFAMVNLNCTIGHESSIGAGSVINPLTAISGGVKIGKSVLVGTHAAILQYISIGDHAVIGSGAMVNKDVEPNATVMGVPARPKVMAASAH
jgi:sugar O-acyltransferase (sialic acid O-acetyltransferase NeuD family)